MTIDPGDYSDFAWNVYSKQPAPGALPTGWIELNTDDFFSTDQGALFLGSDLGTAAYVNASTNEIVIAFDGWEGIVGGTIEEWDESIDIHGGTVGAYYAQAYLFTEYVKSLDETEDKTISFTGHSQGGAIAGLMAAHYGVEATVFNPQGAEPVLSETAVAHTYYIYDGEFHTQPIGDGKGGTFPPDDTITVPGGVGSDDEITSIRVKGDIAGSVDDQIGTVTEIDLGAGGPIAYHSMALMRFMIEAGKEPPALPPDPPAPELYKVEALQAELGSLVGLLVDDDLHVDALPDADARPFEIYLTGLVDAQMDGRPCVDVLIDDLTQVAALHQVTDDQSSTDALVQLAVQRADGQLALSGDPQGIYVADQNAFVVDCTALPLAQVEGGEPDVSQVLGREAFAQDQQDIWTITIAEAPAYLEWFLPPDTGSIPPSSDFQALVIAASHETGLADAYGPLDKSCLILGGLANDAAGGNTKNDFLYGDAGNDTLSGGSGDDILIGGANNDNLTGGLGSDLLFGGAGKDTLDGTGDHEVDPALGWVPTDVLVGGAGDDTFLCDGYDVILDPEIGDELYVAGLRISGGSWQYWGEEYNGEEGDGTVSTYGYVGAYGELYDASALGDGTWAISVTFYDRVGEYTNDWTVLHSVSIFGWDNQTGQLGLHLYEEDGSLAPFGPGQSESLLVADILDTTSGFLVEATDTQPSAATEEVQSSASMGITPPDDALIPSPEISLLVAA